MEKIFMYVDISKLSKNQAKLCEKDLTEKYFIQVSEKHAKLNLQVTMD